MDVRLRGNAGEANMMRKMMVLAVAAAALALGSAARAGDDGLGGESPDQSESPATDGQSSGIPDLGKLVEQTKCPRDGDLEAFRLCRQEQRKAHAELRRLGAEKFKGLSNEEKKAALQDGAKKLVKRFQNRPKPANFPAWGSH